MKKLLGFIATFMAVAGVAVGAWAQDGYAYSAAFQQVRSTLGGLSPLKATKALRAFADTPQSPDLCETAALDNALGEREKLLVVLVGKNGKKTLRTWSFAAIVERKKTARCQSPNEDGTAHPNLSGTLTPLKAESAGTFAIKSQLPDAKLYAVYLTTLRKALVGKPAKRLAPHISVNAKALTPATVLIAADKTQGTKRRTWRTVRPFGIFWRESLDPSFCLWRRRWSGDARTHNARAAIYRAHPVRAMRRTARAPISACEIGNSFILQRPF